MGITVCRRFSILMAQSEDALWQKLMTWKSTLEAKGLKVNVSKTKLMFGGNVNNAAVGQVKYQYSLQ